MIGIIEIWISFNVDFSHVLQWVTLTCALTWISSHIFSSKASFTSFHSTFFYISKNWLWEKKSLVDKIDLYLLYYLLCLLCIYTRDSYFNMQQILLAYKSQDKIFI